MSVRKGALAYAVRMGMSAADGEELSDLMPRLPADVRYRVLDQLWLRSVLTEQRRRTRIAERDAFDARADRLLEALDPPEKTIPWTVEVCPTCQRIGNTCQHVELGGVEPITTIVVPATDLFAVVHDKAEVAAALAGAIGAMSEARGHLTPGMRAGTSEAASVLERAQATARKRMDGLGR